MKNKKVAFPHLPPPRAALRSLTTGSGGRYGKAHGFGRTQWFSRSIGLLGFLEKIMVLLPTEREHLEMLTDNAEWIEPHRKLIAEGRASDCIFILLDGWISEFRVLRNGNRQILDFRLPGDIVGVECLAYGTALYSSAALTKSAVARLSVEAFERIQQEFPRLATALFLMTLRHGAILHEWEVNLGRRDGLMRVAHLLVELNRRLRFRGLASGDTVPFPPTQQDLADCTGLTGPYVNRVLQQLRRKDLIEVGDKTLQIKNPTELARVAGFTGDYLEKWGQGRSSLTPAARNASGMR